MLAPIALVVSAGIVAAVQIGKGVVALPAVQADMSLSLVEVSTLLSVFAVFGALAAMPSGALAGRFGARRALLLGLLLLCLGNLVGVFAGSFPVLLMGRVVEGAGFIAVATAAPILLGRMSTAENRSQVFAVWGAYMPAGMGLMLVAGMAVALADWRLLWQANAVLTALWLVLCYRLVPADPSGQPDKAGFAVLTLLREFLRDGRPILVTASFFVYASFYFAVVGLLPAYLLSQFGMRPQLVGVVAALVVFANMIGNLSAGVLFRRGWGLDQVMLGAFVGSSSFAVATFLLSTSGLQAAALVSLSMLCAGAIPASVMASAPRIAHRMDHVGAMIGLFMQGSTLGQFTGPLLFAAAVEGFGWTWAGACLVLPAIVGIACLLALRRTGAGLGPSQGPAR